MQLFDDDAEAAVETLGGAWRMWQQLDLPFEMALARGRLAEARRATGDDSGALMELKAALSTLESLGATTEAAAMRAALGDAAPAGSAPSTRVTRTFMFTDIVTSTDLIGLIGDESWQELLRWHDKTLSSAIEHAAGEVVRHTGDGFFASFAETRPALDCAVDIQRRLASHRTEAGFAPFVRIGLHRAEATREGADYSGGGIHVAARIGDVGDAEEIVVSSSTLAEVGVIPYSVSDPSPVDLKGVKGPIELQRLDWR